MSRKQSLTSARSELVKKLMRNRILFYCFIFHQIVSSDLFPAGVTVVRGQSVLINQSPGEYYVINCNLSDKPGTQSPVRGGRMSLFAGAGGKAGASKKVQHNQELGAKFAAVKVLLESSVVSNLYPLQSRRIVFISNVQTPENDFKSSPQTVLEHVGLYVGLACYTALGAKVFQMLENPHEMEKSAHFQSVLNSSRNNFLERVSHVSKNAADCNSR